MINVTLLIVILIFLNVEINYEKRIVKLLIIINNDMVILIFKPGYIIL